MKYRAKKCRLTKQIESKVRQAEPAMTTIITAVTLSVRKRASWFKEHTGVEGIVAEI